VLTIGEQISEAIRLHQNLPEIRRRGQGVEMLRRVRIPEPAREAGEYPRSSRVACAMGDDRNGARLQS
jgi:peptide/nickel transport system ATP-binding protein